MPSLFTKIIQREIPSKIEYEDEDFIVIHDIAPKAPVHLLIIPKQEIPTVDHFVAEHADLIAKMIFLAQEMKKKTAVAGYQLRFHVGEKGGQEVMHVHLHFLGYK